MKTREPWLGVASAIGLIVMLLGEGAVDGLGLLIAIAPLVLGLGSALVRRRHQGDTPTPPSEGAAR